MLSVLDKYFQNSNTKTVLKFLLAASFLKLIYIAFIPITPQEAYYWYYSKNPDFSYFDHPPMTAYSIWLGTNIFGDNSFGVKFLAVVWSFLTQFLLYITAKRFFMTFQSESESEKKSFLSLLIYNLTIFGHLYSVTIVPDTPLLFFWLLVIYSVQEYLLTNKNRFWILAGLSLGLGMLSKYSMVIITVAIFIMFIISKVRRKELLNPFIYLAVIVSVIVFTPVLYWNFRHEWASFLFQTVERAEKTKAFTFKYFFQLIVSQFFMLTPFVFVLIAITLKKWFGKIKNNFNAGIYFLSAAVTIILFTYVSFKSLVKMNWLLPGYLGAIILSADVVFASKIRLKKTLVIISVGLIIIGYSVMIFPNIPLGEGNTWSGWKDAAGKIYQIQNKLGGKEKVFVFGNSYKSAAMTKFYLPDKQNTYAENIFGQRALQFDYWNNPNELKGKNALYVFDNRKEYKAKLGLVEKYFDKVEPIKKFEYKFFGITTRIINCYLCVNYHGTEE